MDLSPPSLDQSPSSPSNTYCPSERSSLDYPTPELVEQQYKLSPIYGAESCCSMTPSLGGETSLPPLGQSPDWDHAHMMHPPSSASAMPSIISTEYDAFPDYSSPYGHDVYHAHTAHNSPVPSSTSPSTGPPARSPMPAAARAPSSYLSATSVPGPMTQRLKMDSASEYNNHAMDVSHYPSPRSVHSVPPSYSSESVAYSTTTTGYMSDTSSPGWHRSEFQPGHGDNFYSAPGSHADAFMQDARRAYRVQRPRRAPRRLTTKEEANYQCEVKGCGKLFSRSYNYKAHMETHDEKREFPFPCMIPDCNKKFVRKTDLQRHHSSVHAKERNHKCDFCERMFARKDTLRRLVELARFKSSQRC